MSNISDNNKRIAKNSLFLYIRMLLTMGVALFTSRVVLRSLGVQDFGIYNVVGGVVAMLGLIKGVMTGASARFLNIALGRNDLQLAKRYFSVGVTIYAVLCVVLVILAETVGLWFVNTQLVLPEERMFAANCVYQFSIVTMINSMMSISYNAAIVAHEKMNIYAYIGLIEVVVKLIIAFTLSVIPFDRLIVYGFLLMISELTIRLIYRIYCSRSFCECSYSFVSDKNSYKEILSYSAWNLFGVFSSLIKSHGLNILLNMFFNPAVNAARGIAYQVNHAILQFSNNFYTAVKPQITKYYARGEFNNLVKLVNRSSKMTLFLMYFLSLPIFIETPFVIRLWLAQCPEYVVSFVRYMLVISILESMSYPLMTAVQATGRVAKYQMIVGFITSLNIPFSYVLLKMGCLPIIVFQVSLVLTIILQIIRIFILKRLIPFDACLYVKDVIIRGLLVVSVSGIMPVSIILFFDEGWLRFSFVLILSCFFTSLLSLYIGFNSQERNKVIGMFFSKFKSHKKNAN